MTNARKYAGEGGATLGEYAVIVALLSLVLVVATPGISREIKRTVCNLITLGDNFYYEDNGEWHCVLTTFNGDLGGTQGVSFGLEYW